MLSRSPEGRKFSQSILRSHFLSIKYMVIVIGRYEILSVRSYILGYCLISLKDATLQACFYVLYSTMTIVIAYMTEIHQYTPTKFNSSPLKNGGCKTSLFEAR